MWKICHLSFYNAILTIQNSNDYNLETFNTWGRACYNMRTRGERVCCAPLNARPYDCSYVGRVTTVCGLFVTPNLNAYRTMNRRTDFLSAVHFVRLICTSPRNYVTC